MQNFIIKIMSGSLRRSFENLHQVGELQLIKDGTRNVFKYILRYVYKTGSLHGDMKKDFKLIFL